MCYCYIEFFSDLLKFFFTTADLILQLITANNIFQFHVFTD